ncbi:MAG: hypothetical protein KTR21_09240, partial [Rhodobacteraceae bacterium]|nr:hypothetical protein [Paracoccaceae bacterium]
MGKRGLAPFLLRRSGRLHYRRRVPDLYRSVDPRREVNIALQTYDEEVANAKAVEITAQLTAYWEALLSGDETEAARRALELERIARGAGFAYRSAAELAAGDVSEIMARVTYLHTKGLSGDAASVEALLAGDAAPAFPISEALEFFFQHTQDRVRGKSPDQLRRWRTPRMLVV